MSVFAGILPNPPMTRYAIHHMATAYFLECLLGHYFANYIGELSVPGNVSHSYDLCDTLKRRFSSRA